MSVFDPIWDEYEASRIAGDVDRWIAQWTDDAALNTPVVTSAQDQDVIKLGVAPDGSSWTGWFDFQPGFCFLKIEQACMPATIERDSARYMARKPPSTASSTPVCNGPVGRSS